MSTYVLSTSEVPRREFRIPHIDALRPFRWLRQGLNDLLAAPGLSLGYGAAVAAVAAAFVFLTVGGSQFFLVPFLNGADPA